MANFMSDLGGLTSRSRSKKKINQLQSYLKHYGYLQDKNPLALVTRGIIPSPPKATAGKFDEVLEDALKSYQTFHGLPPTGELDEATALEMDLPRCGCPDRPGPSGPSPFLAVTRWPRNKLTYRFDSFSAKVTETEAKAALASAFFIWSTAAQIDFEEVNSGSADFKITFHDPQAGSPIENPGVGGVLAQAFFPNDGRIQFDDGEPWSVASPPPRGSTDLITVAAHEIGHALGLDHSSVRGALMFPTYSGPQRALSSDDRQGIRFLYGARAGVII